MSSSNVLVDSGTSRLHELAIGEVGDDKVEDDDEDDGSRTLANWNTVSIPCASFLPLFVAQKKCYRLGQNIKPAR